DVLVAVAVGSTRFRSQTTLDPLTAERRTIFLPLLLVALVFLLVISGHYFFFLAAILLRDLLMKFFVAFFLSAATLFKAVFANFLADAGILVLVLAIRTPMRSYSSRSASEAK